jgi:RNA polymerase sigma factor (sigma-70 family)
MNVPEKLSLERIEKHYQDCRERIVKRITFRVGSVEAAEDIVQEAYYRIIKYRDSYHRGRPLDNWFSTVLRNCISEYKNKERGQPQPDEDNDVDDVASSVELYAEYYKDILELIQTKNTEQRIVLEYYFVNQYSPLDIANITEFNYKRVHKMVERFKKELKELYK